MRQNNLEIWFFERFRSPVTDIIVLALLMKTAVLQTQGLEGSRFITRQLCSLAAGGSRERPQS